MVWLFMLTFAIVENENMYEKTYAFMLYLKT